MTKWFKDYGMKVNEAKLEMCGIHRMDTRPVSLTLNQTHNHIRPLKECDGRSFSHKLNQSNQVSECTKKAKTALHVIRLITNYFILQELK